MTDDPTAFVNGRMWRSPTGEHATVQWLSGDCFVLMSAFVTREGWPGQTPISDPDGSGKIFYTGAEMKTRLMRWKPLTWNRELGWL